MYVVFGKSKVKAMQKAEKKVSPHRHKRVMTLEKYAKTLRRYSGVLYKAMRPCKMSPTYSNLHEAQQYMQLAEDAGAASEMFIKRMEQRTYNPETGKHSSHWTAL